MTRPTPLNATGASRPHETPANPSTDTGYRQRRTPSRRAQEPVQSAQQLAEQLGGRRCGDTWMCLCVAHDDRTPSLAIGTGDDGRPLLHCHAGCTQAAVIDALRASHLWAEGDRIAPDPRRLAVAHASALDGDRGRTDAALRIWSSTRRAVGSLVERYLRARSIALEVSERLHVADLVHSPTRQRWPAMVALVTDVRDRPIGVHRTYLARDGCGKAPIEPPKMSLGPIRAGAVRLAPAAERILVAEGIETALAACELSGIPAWAALSAGGLERLELPRIVRSIVIAADRDASGTGQRAALAAAQRWMREGRTVRVLLPPDGTEDFAELLEQRKAGAR